MKIDIKDTLTTVLTALIIIFTALIISLPTAHIAAQGNPSPTEIIMQNSEVEYTLPHPGILPDHPLYGIKKFRDMVWVFLMRDHVRKAEVLLLQSDKKVAMAQALAEKGKWNLTAETLGSAEKDFTEVIEALEMSKQIGSSASEDFIDVVILSNEKHVEVMEDILAATPQGVRSEIEEIIQINIDNYNALNSL